MSSDGASRWRRDAAAGQRPGRAHRRTSQLVVEGQHRAAWLAGGRPVAVQHLVEERGARLDPVAPARGTPRRARRRPRARWRPGVSPSRPRSTCRAASGAEPVDHRVLEPAGPRSAASARARSSSAVMTSSVRTAPLVARGRGRCAGPARPASQQADQRHEDHHRRQGRQRRCLRGGVEALADLALEPGDDPLEEVLLVVLRMQQLAAQLGPGLRPRRARAAGREAERHGCHAGDPGLLHQLDVVGLLAHPLVEVLQRGHRRGERRDERRRDHLRRAPG